jgi:hypothetical protein
MIEIRFFYAWILSYDLSYQFKIKVSIYENSKFIKIEYFKRLIKDLSKHNV